jgi:hypothetical protein
MQNTTALVVKWQQQSTGVKNAPQAMKIECLRKYLSAKTPAIRAPNNAPSSSTAANKRVVVGEASLRNYSTNSSSPSSMD